MELWNFAKRKHTVVESVCGTLKCGRLRESLIISGAVEEVMLWEVPGVLFWEVSVVPV